MKIRIGVICLFAVYHGSSFKDGEEKVKANSALRQRCTNGLPKHSALLQLQGSGGERTEKSLYLKGQLGVREMKASELLMK